MSKLTLILIITALFFSCNNKKRNDYVIFSGKVENPNSDSLTSTISPSFKLNDINGKIVALEDLRGKAVYIDIWSTGCSPCMAEIPYLNALEEYYQNKDIQFVSINIIDSEERWKNIIKEKGLKGVQLYAGDGKILFLKDYLVRGIPRYILIDKDGRIIDSSAKRPSDPKLKGQIDKLI